MIRQLFRTGNSIVLALPKEVLHSLGLKEGANVILNLDRRQVIVTPAEKPIPMAGVNETFTRQVEEFIQYYRPALEELAK